jgi:L,D-transpeptidase ErfK/SrfK
VPLGPDGKPAETVIGAPRTFRIRNGDTFFDVARWFDVGYDQLVRANPGVDPWIPPVGTTVTVPGAWVLPCCTYEGIVVNVPEMRLFFYRREPGVLLVDTYPVGVGRRDRQTPRGRFHVATKTVNPTWIVPENIRQEHIRERGDARTSIPGGHPDNPLGKYRLGLSKPLYGIHGTNVPWGAGMTVSHGCVRLYPEDIERLYPDAVIKTPVEFVYQPVKVGTRRNDVYLEEHPDIYGLARAPLDQAVARIRTVTGNAGGRVDTTAIRSGLESSRGLPVRVSPAPRRGGAQVAQAERGMSPEGMAPDRLTRQR